MHASPDVLQFIWFALIGILWAGYFLLEGFDFGVGMLVRPLGRGEAEKRTIIHTIGPVWDGNEVWLLVAGGATFAAFPQWYATTFSGFYLALFLVLACLIVRGVSFEFWAKRESERWRSGWEWAMGISSGLVALLFGVAWANFIAGVPMGADHIVHASLWTLLNPYALLGGIVTLVLFLCHGSTFLALRTVGDIQTRAQQLSARVAPVVSVLIVAFLVWTAVKLGFGGGRLLIAAVAAIAAMLIPVLVRGGGDARAFIATSVAVVLFTVVLAVALYPNALPSTTNHAYDLTLAAASSSHYTLVVMTVVTVIFLPIVLAYQAWTYWVFRHRLDPSNYTGEGTPTPLSVIDQKLGREHGQ